MKEKINEIKIYARENRIPIMMDEGINYLCDYIKKNRIKRILEIGSGIGYSSIKMSLLNDQIAVTTLEKNTERYNIAIKNIKNLKLKKRITILNIDGLEWTTKDKFDLIFIDASKSHNTDFFNRYKNNLNKNGRIITDNLSFHGLVENNSLIKTKNQENLVRKIKEYINFLTNSEEYITEIIDIGDKIAISKRVDCDDQNIDRAKN